VQRQEEKDPSFMHNNEATFPADFHGIFVNVVMLGKRERERRTRQQRRNQDQDN